MSEREESEYVHLCARELSGNLTPSELMRLEELDAIAQGHPRSDSDGEQLRA